jgi:MtN3 and saliva related transmembrane protein
MAPVEVLGLLAGALTTAAFVPQVLRTHRTRSAEDFSLPMLVLFVAGVALWLGYGLWLGAPSVVAANAVTLVLAGYILRVKLLTRRRVSPATPAAR